MKILLVSTSELKLENQNTFIPQLGLILIGQSLVSNGHEVEFFAIPQKKYDKDNFDSWLSNITTDILNRNCDIIGISSMSKDFNLLILIIKALRVIDKTIPIIIGGPQATVAIEETLHLLNNDENCIISYGEGEETLPELLDTLRSHHDISNIQGIAFIKNGNIKINPPRNLISNLEYNINLSYPAVERYISRFNAKNIFYVEGGRGCSYNCEFCCTSTIWRRYSRRRTAKAIYNDFFAIYLATGCKTFSVIHDNIFLGKSDFHEFLRELKILNKQNFKWRCSIRVDHLTPTLLNEMVEAGCENIFIGVETGSDKMQKIYNKNLDLEKTNKILDYIQILPITYTLSYICGHPKESKQDIEDTLLHILKYANSKNCLVIQLNKLIPEIGSELYTKYSKNLYLKSDLKDYISESEYNLILANPSVFAAYYNFSNLSDEVRSIADRSDFISDSINMYPQTIQEIVNNLEISLYDLFSNNINTFNKLLLNVFEKNGKEFPYKIKELYKKERKAWLNKIRELYRNFGSDMND